MARLRRNRIVLKWRPSAVRRVLTVSALVVSALVVVVRIRLIPQFWRYTDGLCFDTLLWLVCIPPIILLWLDLRRVFPPGHCQECGYDLAGKTIGVCPECGETISERPAPEKRHFSRTRLGRTGRMLGRRGRVLKWTGAATCTVIFLAWVGSVPLQLGYVYAYGTPGSRQGSYHIHLNDGRINISHLNYRWRYGSYGYWEVVWPDVHLKWTPIVGTYIGANRTIKTRSVPLWVPWVIVAIPTALLFWLDRRRIPSGYCKKCGYDLTGNVSGICPECGEMVPPQQSA